MTEPHSPPAMIHAPLSRFLWLTGVLGLCGGRVPAQEAEPLAGLVALRQACLDASTDAVILNVAAHPDDESSRTNTILRRKYGARVVTAYATYGDGGQNAIGKEIGPELAHLRVRETLRAAAMMDVEVRWLGMSDFGFSKTLEETLEVWGRERLLAAMRAVFAEIDPDIVTTNHNLTEGHGHHRASFWAIHTVLAERAANGLPPVPLYSRCGPEDAHFTLDPTELDAVRGETYARIAHRAWTQHVTQGPWGPHDPLRVRRDHWRLAFPADLDPALAGDPHRWVRQRGAASTWNGTGSARAAIAARARQLLPEVRRQWLQAREEPSAAGAAADAAGSAAVLRRRLDSLQRVLLADAGVSVETWLERDEVPLGGEGRAYVVVHGFEHVADVAVHCGGEPAEAVRPRVRRATDVLPAAPAGAGEGEGAGDNGPIDSAVPARLPAEPAAGGRYVAGFAHVPRAPVAAEEEAPDDGPEPAWIELEIAFTLDGLPIELRPRLPYTPVAPVAVLWDRDAVMVPEGRTVERILSATVTKHRDADLSEPVRLLMGPGIRAEAIPGRLHLTGEHPEARLLVRATFVAGELSGEPALRIDVDGHTATLQLVPVLVQVPEDLRVGLVRGPDDTLERALADLGVDYTALDRDALATTRLEQFGTLLLDMRTYHHRPELAEVRDRILQFCRAGGRVVAMYHKPGEWNERGGHPLLAPFPLEVGRDRVTEEDSPVTMLVPQHRVWQHPHAITAADFDGWVQERGLNFPEKWDTAWTPLLELKDSSDEKASQGAMLYTRYGRGDFVYCSLVLYRQLRRGHAGAARILVNLLAR